MRAYEIVCHSLNHFLTTLCLRDAVFGARRQAATMGGGALEDTIAGTYVPVWLNGQYVDEDLYSDFFASPDGSVLVKQDSETMFGRRIWLGSQRQSLRNLARPGIRYSVQDY